MTPSPDRRLALTLHCEWAWAVARLGKDVENRDWCAPEIVGQWLCIHGGASIGGRPLGKRGPTDFHRAALASMAHMAERASGIVLSDEEIGAHTILDQGRGIVAICKVAGFERGPAKGWYIGEPSIGWHLCQIRRLPTPVPCPGKQGLWEVPAEIVAQVREQLRGGP